MNFEAPKGATFEGIAREWFDRQKVAWSSGHGARVLARMEPDLFPEIGDMEITSIEPPDVLAAVQKVEDRGAIEMARRIRQYASGVFAFAIASGRAVRDPSADIVKALSKKPRPKRRAALRERDLPEFFARLASYQGDERTPLLIELVAHTFVRTQEIRLATWDELDGDVWRIPAAHMKMKLEHMVPLTPQTKALFARLREITPGARIAPVSANTMIYAMYRMCAMTTGIPFPLRSLLAASARSST